MEVYKSETREVLNRFLQHRLSFPNCIAALDAALAGLVPKLTVAQIAPLREIMLANNATVMQEMEKRWPELTELRGRIFSGRSRNRHSAPSLFKQAQILALLFLRSS